MASGLFSFLESAQGLMKQLNKYQNISLENLIKLHGHCHWSVPSLGLRNTLSYDMPKCGFLAQAQLLKNLHLAWKDLCGILNSSCVFLYLFIYYFFAGIDTVSFLSTG